MRKTSILFLTVMLASSQVAASSDDGRRSLKGISAVSVVVMPLGAEAQSAGLTKKQLKTDVELKLRQANIKINEVGPVFLHVNVNYIEGQTTSGLKTGSFCASIMMVLSQLAFPIQNLELVRVSTWFRIGLSTGPSRDAESEVRSQVRDYVDQFINDYLAANPKETEEPKTPTKDKLPL